MDTTRTTLLVRLRNRSDQEAWQTFDRLYRPLIMRFACTRGLDQAAADDVAQQCMEAVLANIGRYQHSGSFRGWLRTIAGNKIKDAYRRQKDRQADTDVFEREVDSQPGPHEMWDKHWLREHLRYCIEQVRPQVAEHTYQAFHQTVIEQRSAGETAEQLGLTLNQVYVARHRVLARVRALLTELGQDELAGEWP